MNNIIGVDERAMDNLILDIKDRMELCSNILNNMEDCVENALAYYKSDDKRKLEQKFQSLRASFPTLISNMETYTNDLVRAKNGYAVIDKIVTTKVINGQERMKAKEVK